MSAHACKPSIQGWKQSNSGTLLASPSSWIREHSILWEILFTEDSDGERNLQSLLFSFGLCVKCMSIHTHTLTCIQYTQAHTGTHTQMYANIAYTRIILTCEDI